jgi:N-acetyl-alpha-D-glucosaminyl L-malate synthase BshA
MMIKRPLKIGITCYPTYGGSGVVASELGLQLARLGHEIHFISYDRPFRIPVYQERVYFHKVQVVEYPLFQYPPYSLALTSKMVEVANQAKLDLLHVHYAVPHTASAYMAKQMLEGKIKIVTTLHGTDITLVGSNPNYMPITRYSLDNSDGITAVSEYLRLETIETFGVTTAIEVIPNFVNPEVFYRKRIPNERKAFAPNGEKIVMHLSNFRPVKRLGDIVDAFALVHKEIPSKLILVGDGPERYRAEQHIRENNLGDDVLFLGKQEAIVELFSVADVYFLPSETESFGLSALEAMSCQVPVVATCVGGLPEVVVHGESGFLCCVGDVYEMAEAIKMLLQNDRRRKAMGKTARERAITQFHIHDVVAQYEAYYRRLIN